MVNLGQPFMHLIALKKTWYLIALELKNLDKVQKQNIYFKRGPP